jgi:hypothetical protein
MVAMGVAELDECQYWTLLKAGIRKKARLLLSIAQ